MTADKEQMPIGERLKSHSRLFDSLISMIPAKFYLTSPADMTMMHPSNTISTNTGTNSSKNPFIHNKKRKATPEELKETKKVKKNVKNAKLDPELQKSTVDIQKEQSQKHKTSNVVNSNNGSNSSKGGSSGLSISQLKDKLHAKIQELQAKRNCVNPEKKKSREKIIEERRRDKIVENAKKEEQAKQLLISGSTGKHSGKSMELHDKQSKSATPPVEIEENIQVGNKIEFHDDSEKQQKKKVDPKVALQKLQQQKQKLEKIKSTDEQKASRIQNDIKWKKTLQMAEGEKVKDNEKLLKKSIKRIEKTKEKSKKAWEERKQQVKETHDKRQQKRRENIKKRIQDKKQKKVEKRRKGF